MGMLSDILFVNRGFVPYDRKDAGSRPQSTAKGPQTMTGLARMPLLEKPGFLVPDNAPEKNQYFWKDLAAMRVRVKIRWHFRSAA